MIVFDLNCASGHRFEGWFGSSRDFADQQESGLLACPSCGSVEIEKAPMAPAVPRKGASERQMQRVSQPPQPSASVARGPLPPALVKAFAQLAEVQREALRHSRWVGDTFAEASRAMHYGEREEETIHGQATAEEALALVEEGIPIAPLPFPVAPPDEVN